MQQQPAFTDFNPLDVLAAAASLQRDGSGSEASVKQGSSGDADSQEDETGDGEDGETAGTSKPEAESGLMLPPRTDRPVIRLADRPVTRLLSHKQESTVTVANRDVTQTNTGNVIAGNKQVSGLRMNQAQMTDHSYAFVCQIANLRTDEDEGYSSRSSVDEEGDDVSKSGIPLTPGAPSRFSPCSSSGPRTPASPDLDSPQACDSGSPGVVVIDSQINPSNDLNKPSKIVIINKETSISSKAHIDPTNCRHQ